jgi:hypothetical protein
MKDSILVPCADWAGKLATPFQDDLSYAERVALNEHLASCPKCAAVYSFYRVIGNQISDLPAVEPLPGLPLHLLQRMERSASYKRRPEPAILTWFKSLPADQLHNAFNRLVQAISTALNQRVRYASTNDHSLYALQSAGGPLLWQYKKSSVFFSSPAMKNGAAFLTSFDSQIFLFAAVMHLRPCNDSFLWRN